MFNLRRRLILLLLVPMAVVAAPPAPVVEDEVNYLLDHLERSGCEFYRNGSWYAGAKAKSHLRQKYDYLIERDLIKNTEDFVRLAGTQSSLSGKRYQVRCAPQAPVASADWLANALNIYRQRNPTK